MNKDIYKEIAALSKQEQKDLYDKLISRLVVLQQQARFKGIGLVVDFEGCELAGKGTCISKLMYSLDARSTIVYDQPLFDFTEAMILHDWNADVSGQHPLMEPYWKALGERGTMTIFDGGWYALAANRACARCDGSPVRAAELFGNALQSIKAFEGQLAADGYIVVKFFMDISKEEQKRRRKKMKKDPLSAWRVDIRAKQELDHDRMSPFFNKAREENDFDFAPWIVLDSTNPRAAYVSVAQTLVDVLEEAVSVADPEVPQGVQVAQAVEADAPKESRFTICDDYPRLANLSHSLVCPPEEYKLELRALQKRLNELQVHALLQNVPLIVMYEGWDAAGKGGNIKRLAQALDARSYRIYPSPSPTKTELMHPFLWRYWTRLPEAGKIGIYDRSWYGRVLVERVEGFATPQEWGRAYDEINEFELDLVKWGAVLIKFWVDVSEEEQLRRFEERQNTPEKQWKITEEDWRNREKNDKYAVAIDDMFRLTSTTTAPWTVLESDNKQYARLKALRVIVDALEKRLDE